MKKKNQTPKGEGKPVCPKLHKVRIKLTVRTCDQHTYLAKLKDTLRYVIVEGIARPEYHGHMTPTEIAAKLMPLYLALESDSRKTELLFDVVSEGLRSVKTHLGIAQRLLKSA